MIQLKKTFAKSTFICTAVFLFASCQFNGLKGSGKVTTENRTISGDFKSIKAEKGLDVVLEQGTDVSVAVIADDNVQKHISTTVENGVLKITSDVNNFFDVTSKKVVVKMPSIENIQVSSGASLNSRNTIKSNTITLKSSSGGSLSITIIAEKATCESSSGSSITVNGKAIDLETAASSGSDISAEKLLSNNITASASSGSTIAVYPLVRLNADASSGANINYYYVPQNINKKSSSGGSISKE